MASYTNPWHKPGKPEYGPAVYETDAAPTEYGGHLIYRRLPVCWDVVKDGACVTQMAGPDGAKRAVDAINARAQNVATATDNADLFAEVATHNREVIRRRQSGESWEAPENQYRNAWIEIGTPA